MDKKKYRMRCKNPNCKIEGGYVYWVIAVKYDWEHCNLCGHCAPFDEFIEEVEQWKLQE